MTSYRMKSLLNGTKDDLYVLITKMETFVEKTTQCCCEHLYTAGRFNQIRKSFFWDLILMGSKNVHRQTFMNG